MKGSKSWIVSDETDLAIPNFNYWHQRSDPIVTYDSEVVKTTTTMESANIRGQLNNHWPFDLGTAAAPLATPILQCSFLGHSDLKPIIIYSNEYMWVAQEVYRSWWFIGRSKLESRLDGRRRKEYKNIVEIAPRDSLRQWQTSRRQRSDCGRRFVSSYVVQLLGPIGTKWFFNGTMLSTDVKPTRRIRRRHRCFIIASLLFVAS